MSALTLHPGQTSLAHLDAALPRRLFASEAEHDIGRLAQVARVLLCLDRAALGRAAPHIPRLVKALCGLLHLQAWPDLLQRNPALLVSALPLVRLYRRLDLPRLEEVLGPVRHLLAQRLLEQGEWMPPYQLELSVGLLELGFAPLLPPEEARAATLLAVPVPGWVWCFEKTSVLDFLVLVVGGAGETLPEGWRASCQADLLSALRSGDALALGRAAFHLALAGDASASGPARTLLERAWSAPQPPSPRPWEAVLGHAYFAASLLITERDYVCTL